jgi:hypothetical protein
MRCTQNRGTVYQKKQKRTIKNEPVTGIFVRKQKMTGFDRIFFGQFPRKTRGVFAYPVPETPRRRKIWPFSGLRAGRGGGAPGVEGRVFLPQRVETFFAQSTGFW